MYGDMQMIGTSKDLIKWLLEQDEEKKFEVQECKGKRSLSQNSYCWLLINKIANILRLSKEEIYLQMLEDYGQSILIPVKKGEKPNGYFKYYKYETSSILNGKEADWYKIYKGSSEFDSKEMTILIDGIIQECKQLGIETLPLEELKRLGIK